VRPAESLQLAQEQFRSGQFEATLPALRRIEAAGLSKEDRVLVRYLIAGCLRNLNQLDEAVAAYNEIVASRDDETLVESAKWQLAAVESRRNMTRELAEIRARRQTQ
jgi:hypothetical protein